MVCAICKLDSILRSNVACRQAGVQSDLKTGGYESQQRGKEAMHAGWLQQQQWL